MTAPAFSVVIAAYDEAEAIGGVLDELRAVLAGEGCAAEIVVVDDGSGDATPAVLRACLGRDPGLRVVRLGSRCGKSAAVRVGVEAARAPLVVTMDGDGQNDPRDAVRLARALEAAAGAALVAGIRERRHDRASRRFATRFANGLRRRVLGDGCPDTGCGLKAFARDEFLRLPAFEGMHRFLPALFGRRGVALVCVPVADRARAGGRSKYTNWGRALVGVVDLLGVVWLRGRTRVPVWVREVDAPPAGAVAVAD
jgi:dolichol-phosphate mannosyltransferase